MHAQIFVNLPVRDLARAIGFFEALGYTFNPDFSDETATCMIVGENIFVMLLTHEKFKEFTKNSIADATKTTEVLICLSCDSREEVDSLVRKALSAGATSPNPSQDHGFMYGHGFQDLDGHIWELVHMAN